MARAPLADALHVNQGLHGVWSCPWLFDLGESHTLEQGCAAVLQDIIAPPQRPSHPPSSECAQDQLRSLVVGGTNRA